MVSDLEMEYRAYTFRKLIIIFVFLIGIFIAAGISLSINGMDIGFWDCYNYVWNHIIGTEYELRTPEWRADYMLWNIRLPRIIMAIIVGIGLASCGVAMQSLMSNPLADPYTVGISDGACFGAVSAIVMGFTLTTALSSMGVVISAFIGGLIPAIIIIILSRIVNLTPATAILVGIALSYIFSGMETVVMTSTDADTLKAAYLWQIGTLNGATWEKCLIPAIITAVCSAFLLFSSKNLNLLVLGDESAKSLGLNVDQFRFLCMIVVSVTVAALVSYVGIIGFVGLIIPHVIRMIVGANTKFLIPASMLGGALFLLVADLISRTVVYPDELRVGLVASIIGSPIFLYIILKKKQRYGEVF